MTSTHKNVLFGFGLGLAILAAAGVTPALAQEVTNPINVGFPEGGIFSGSTFDNVQLNNGNLHIEIPIHNVPGRGLPATFRFVYDSKGWRADEHCFDLQGLPVCAAGILPEYDHIFPNQIHNMHGRFVGSEKYRLDYDAVTMTCPGGSQEFVYVGYTVREPDGTKHHFLPDPAVPGGNPCWGASQQYMYADDGSGWMIEIDPNTGVPVDARRKDGAVLTVTSSGAVSTFRDSNGNILIGGPDGGDTLGRAFPGLTYTDSNGATQNIQVDYVDVDHQTNLCSFWGPEPPERVCTENQGTYSKVKRITFPPPNSMIYTFHWQGETGASPLYPTAGHGELREVELPTGGKIKYVYAGLDEGGPLILSRTEESGGQSRTWLYGISPLGASATVTDPLGNATVTTFSRIRPGFQDEMWRFMPEEDLPTYPVKVESYEGAATGTPLRTVATDYDNTGTVIPIRETSTLHDTNQVSKVETDYDSITLWSGPFTWKNVMERREYAYGASAPGPLVRKTQYDYLHLGSQSSTYQPLNIANHRTEERVYDAGGATLSWTIFDYDTTAVIGSPDAPNHDAAFGTWKTTRGNLTRVQRLRSGAWLVTVNDYDKLGNLKTSTDPMGHATTYKYLDDWGDTPAAHCPPPAGDDGQAYPTLVTNHLVHHSEASYYSCTGLAQSTRDENDILAGRNGTESTFDKMHRPVTTLLPEGGRIDMSYLDTPPIKVTRTTKVDATQNLVESAEFDDFGRLTWTELTDPDCGAGPVLTLTTYDKLGRKQTVTNPYCTTGDDTYGFTEFGYDALGRVTIVAPPDAQNQVHDPVTGQLTGATNAVTTAYSGNETTVTDQTGKQRKSRSDALGRLTDVWEPNPATGVLENHTQYAYDVTNNLTCVAQKGTDTAAFTTCAAAPDSWRPRSFTYDTLSQLTSADNPESGFVSYFYDNDGNLYSKRDARGIEIGYDYDELHRLTTKSYTDATVPVSYHYDSVPQGGFPATTATGDVLISGAVQSVTEEHCLPGNPPECWDETHYDFGYVWITVGGLQKSVFYGEGSTAASIASELASEFNGDPASPVTAFAGGSIVEFTAKTPGAAGNNYTLSGGTSYWASKFSSPSFTVTPSTSWTRGGADGCTLSLASFDNAVGRRVGMCDAAGAEVWSYDEAGRVEAHKRSTDGLARKYSYAYNEGGALLHTSFDFAGNWKQQYAYNAAGRVTDFTSSSGLNFATGITYHPHGAMKTANLYNSAMFRQDWYKNRLQPCRLFVRTSAAAAASSCSDSGNIGDIMDFDYDFSHGTANNGNVIGMTDAVQSVSFDYAYDKLNRIDTAAATGGASPWSQDFTYDIWGNLYDIDATGGAPMLSKTPTNENQLAGHTYDLSGNMSQSPIGNELLTYDAENRIIQVGANVFYTYDADGNRVLKDVSGTKTAYFRSAADGQVLREFEDSGGGYANAMTYAYLNGEHIASNKPGTGGWKYTFRDHLGTLRVRCGNTTCSSLTRHDFTPFGTEITAPPPDETHRFTDQERDTETGLDYFIARHYGSNIGRFLQGDPIFITLRRLIDPQRINLYAYTRNNPMRFVDADGMTLRLDAQDEEAAKEELAKLKKGLDPADRNAVSLIVGDGSNGCAAGKFCVGVSVDHQSDSANFQTLRSVVGSSDIATLSVVDSSIVITYNSGLNQGGQIVLGETESTYVGDGIPGLTLYQDRGSPLENTLYSTTGDTRAYVSSEQTEIELVATMFHELTHVYLTDFGRKIPKGRGHADKETREAEDEAKKNFQKE